MLERVESLKNKEENMKKIVSFLLACSMVFTLTACGSSDSSSSDGEDVKVAMVTDYGDITDQSFNQTTYEAGKEYCETNGLEFNYYKPTDDTDAARTQMIEKAVEEGYNVILLPGYAFAGSIVEVAGDYPDVKFVALDVAEGDILSAALGDKYDYNPDNWDVKEYYNSDNVYCAIYQEELPGYMAGYTAVKMGYTNLGFLGGMAVPAVIRYGYGFVQGADAAAKELNKQINIKFAYGNQFYGDADITAAMDTWYSKGTEVVFACGGGIYTSACDAASKVKGKVIGVDVDQYDLISEKYSDDSMCVTSAMKGLANTVTTVLDEIVKGNFSNYAGKIDNLGLVSENADENYVSLAPKTLWSDSFTEDDYKALVSKMYNGEITVSNDTNTEPTVTNSTVDYQGNIK
jgi:basic membrane protein A